MTNPFDAVARLAEGRPVVDDLAVYVLACHRLGYENPNLTAHTSQVRDWYDGEANLDLRALDADCVALAAAAGAAEDAARTHTELVAELSDVWAGDGGAAAREFARRSGQAATSVSSKLRTAADALSTLRDELWRAVDAKVTAVQDIDGRHRAERGEWLAAARTVTTGAGDLAAASELVDQHVKPFVQNDIGSDFVGAMRTASASIGTAYDAAIASMSSGAPAVFEVPGELGPRITPAANAGSDGVTAAVASTNPAGAQSVAPAIGFSPPSPPAPGPAWPGSPLVTEPAAGAPLAPLVPPPAAGMPAASSTPSTPSMGELGGAAAGLGGGVSGFGQQLADLIGSLVGSSGGNDDLAGIDEPVGDRDDPDEKIDDEDPDEEDPDDEDPDEEDPDEEDPDDEDPDEPTPDDGLESEGSAEEAVEEAREPVHEPTPVPPPAPDGGPVVPPAVPEGVTETATQTPCEIAADELPQVGE